jgi:hypothetical protein
MSTTGLHTGLYSCIREWAELLDGVLVAMKTGTPEKADQARKRLGQALLRISVPSTTEPHDLLLASLVVGASALSRERIADLGRLLLEAKVIPGLVEDLEHMASVLEHERAGTFAKIRAQ